MSWQDELQQLDSALASGQISADEYRTRRDRVIAQASGQQTPEAPQQPQPGAEPTHVFRPVQPPQGPEGGDPTQFVPGQPPPTGDHTQVVSQDNSADNTQIVPGAAAGGQQPQFPPPQPPPPWETQSPQPGQNMSPPPWANEDLPPEFGQQSWPRQGPEIFEEPGGGNAGKIVAIIVAALLVLGGGGAAVWFFALKDDNDDPQAGGGGNSQTQEPEQTSEEPPPPKLPDGPFIALEGDKEILNYDVPITDPITAGRPTEKEAQLLASAGVTNVGALLSEYDDGLRTGIWAFRVDEGGDPNAVLTAMDMFYEQAQYELISQEDGVLVRKLTNPETGAVVFRAHYVADGGYMVRVEAYAIPDATADAAAVEEAFNDLLGKETDEFPPVS